MALSDPGEFIMFRWDDGSDGDTELIELDKALTVDIQDLAITALS